MVFRFILRFLTNNEQLIHRLSESGPIRGAAKFVVFLFNRGKSIAEEKGLNEKLTPENLKDIAKKFADNVRQQAQEIKRRK